ncbi:SDR family NAD(P)-dependent oxidoreductase [Bordetella holmesii]|uniref:SDR family NAD(P)-dependent oxidoreductase n=1 Tax=Bordetella holmesii TaxID=35814 RepID=UPI001A998B59|nr:SDR family NAD(P)-dependent oxidoreductase [Bordetella holmesii]MBO1261745.1 SDR family NAD(P)-dependent oxidoreductase [Bordetella holmesii]
MTDTFAILTGASRGLGAALARGLLRPGTELVTLARNTDPELARLAREQGVTLKQVQVDLAAWLSAERRIINISSGAGRNPTAGWGVYCATKAAVDMYSRVLKTEHGASGVRVVSLAPGIVDTGMQADIRSSDPQAFPGLTRFQDFHATGKLSAPADVAANSLAYLDREDFGQTEIDDIRNYH